MGPLKLAVVGAGPSAFYTASRILKLAPEPNVRIHMYDRLWAPHGLVRYGVAPDHPEVKNCTNKFDQTALDSRLRFFGNVNVAGAGGSHPIPHALSLPISQLFKHYTHVLFATGSTLPKLHPSLPPSERCIPALDIVHWYTSHPSSRFSKDRPPPLHLTKHVSLIGNGNVSLDIARILLTSPDILAKYDVPSHVIDVLCKSAVEHVSIIARRGPLDAAFTMKELREMMNLPEAAMVPIPKEVLEAPSSPPPSSEGGSDFKDVIPLTRQQSRILSLLKQGSKNAYGSTRKTWSLEFFKSPLGLFPSSSSPYGHSLSLTQTRLFPTTMSSPRMISLPTDLVITSLGFTADPTIPFYDAELGRVRTTAEGRVIDILPASPSHSTLSEDKLPALGGGTVLPNVYAAGWAKNGAKGVLASTMMDGYRVAEVVVDDWRASSSGGPSEQIADGEGEKDPKALDVLPPYIEHALRDKNPPITTYQDWLAVDSEERLRGERVGKERERVGWGELGSILSSSAGHS